MLLGLEVAVFAEPDVHSYCSALIASCLASNVRPELLDGPVESAAEHCQLLLCAPRGKPVRMAAHSSRKYILKSVKLGQCIKFNVQLSVLVLNYLIILFQLHWVCGI